MKKSGKLVLIISVVVILSLSLFLLLKNNLDDEIKEVCVEDKACFNVEIADDWTERQRGLSNRDYLLIDSGMLFTYPEGEIPGFWMKDMNFPLDIIWIDSNMNIVGIEKSLEPCIPSLCPIFSPASEVMYVLEINSGLSDKYDFKDGDLISFD